MKLNLLIVFGLFASSAVAEKKFEPDHKTLIEGLDKQSFNRGKIIYDSMCVICHGTDKKEGSLPTALKFHSGEFKNGADPHGMYKTLTEGFGQMVAQNQYTAQQKYDVIHYIREAFVSQNKAQYKDYNDDYLFSLPLPTGRENVKKLGKPYLDMNYGPFMFWTYQVAPGNISYKSLAMRLDKGSGGVSKGKSWMLFDHDTMGIAAGWTGDFIDWKSIAFDGKHGVHTSILNVENKPKSAPRKQKIFTKKGLQIGKENLSISVRFKTKDPNGTLFASSNVSGKWSPHNKALFLRAGLLTYDEGWKGVVQSTKAFNDGKEHLALLVFNDKELSVYVDGQLEMTSDMWSPDPGNTIFRIGANGDNRFTGEFTGEISSLEYFDRSLDEEQIKQLFAGEHVESDFSYTPETQMAIEASGDANQPLSFVNPYAPAWANPETGSFDDPRPLSRDGIPYGPLPKEWAKYIGIEKAGDDWVIEYIVGSSTFLERQRELEEGVFVRDIVLLNSKGVLAQLRTLVHRVAPTSVSVALAKGSYGSLFIKDGYHYLSVPPSDKIKMIRILISNKSTAELDLIAQGQNAESVLKKLDSSLEEYPGFWKEKVQTKIKKSMDNNAAYVVDNLQVPDKNPYDSWMRMTGFDFFEDADKAAICTWMGDVWLVSGLTGGTLTWQRYAAGLYQPLGLKIVDEQIYVGCRDQIVLLIDKNNDNEADFYACFNNDHQVTEHFHEFAMGLQTDKAGNFYYAKSARHAMTALVPHHGTLLRVSKDGFKTDIIANGFRAANGVCVNDDGSFFVTDQEGHWNPKNRVNWVTEGGYYGNHLGYHDKPDSSEEHMEPPLAWLTNAFNRSPGELFWAKTNQWGPLSGALLEASYGMGRIFLVPHEKVNGQLQGGEIALPIPDFDTGVMRGRFSPLDGQLYTCGMFAWAGNKKQPGGFYRVRYTNKEVKLITGIKSHQDGMSYTFACELDKASAENLASYDISVWDLKRTKNYGSKHLNERSLPVKKATLSEDRKTVRLEIEGLAPTWGMRLIAKVKSASGKTFTSELHNSIYNLGE